MVLAVKVPRTLILRDIQAAMLATENTVVLAAEVPLYELEQEELLGDLGVTGALIP